MNTIELQNLYNSWLLEGEHCRKTAQRQSDPERIGYWNGWADSYFSVAETLLKALINDSKKQDK